MKTIDVAVDRSVNGPMPEYFLGATTRGHLETFTYEYFDWAKKTRHRLLQVALFNRKQGRSAGPNVWLPITTFVLN